MILLITILNTLAIAYLFYKQNGLYLEFKKDRTFINHTLVGYEVTLYRRDSKYFSTGIYTISIPIRNKEKVEKREEILRMVASYSPENIRYSLSAKFSWLKTWEEVRQFEKDYSVVDRKIVANLVSNFRYDTGKFSSNKSTIN
jgi:hypothetical protein